MTMGPKPRGEEVIDRTPIHLLSPRVSHVLLLGGNYHGEIRKNEGTWLNRRPVALEHVRRLSDAEALVEWERSNFPITTTTTSTITYSKAAEIEPFKTMNERKRLSAKSTEIAEIQRLANEAMDQRIFTHQEDWVLQTLGGSNPRLPAKYGNLAMLGPTSDPAIKGTVKTSYYDPGRRENVMRVSEVYMPMEVEDAELLAWGQIFLFSELTGTEWLGANTDRIYSYIQNYGDFKYDYRDSVH